MTIEQEVFEFVRDLILTFRDIDEGAITLERRIEELSLESLDFVELQVELQKNFHVKVQPRMFTNGEIDTIGDFVNHVVGQLPRERRQYAS